MTKADLLKVVSAMTDTDHEIICHALTLQPELGEIVTDFYDVYFGGFKPDLYYTQMQQARPDMLEGLQPEALPIIDDWSYTHRYDEGTAFGGSTKPAHRVYAVLMPIGTGKTTVARAHMGEGDSDVVELYRNLFLLLIFAMLMISTILTTWWPR